MEVHILKKNIIKNISNILIPITILFIMLNPVSLIRTAFAQENGEKQKSNTEVTAGQGEIKKKKKKKSYRPGEILDYMKNRKWYKQTKKKKKKKNEIEAVQDEADLSSIKESASEEIETIIVLLGEIPKDDERNPLFAPVFLTDQKDIFGTKTDFSMKWVGYKLTFNARHKGFPSTHLT